MVSTAARRVVYLHASGNNRVLEQFQRGSDKGGENVEAVRGKL